MPEVSSVQPSGVRAAIARASAATGVNFDYLLAQARIESALDPAAQAATSSAAGLYQFTAGTWLETLEAQEDAPLSFSQAQTLLNKYGDGIQGIFGMTSVATPAAADAVTQGEACGKVSVIGLATPNAMKPFVETDCVKNVVLWNPIDLGYAAVYVTRAVVDGTFKPGDTSVSAGRLGDLQVVNGSEVLLGPPFIYTAENINDFDF